MTTRFELGKKDDAFAVRRAVFMDEQGFKDEFDAIDELASTLHVTLYLDDLLVGCTRAFSDPDHEGRFIFGRLAVLPAYRKRGFGSMLYEASEQAIRNTNAREIHLHAQCSVIAFYQAFGYSEYGDVELDEHVEHIWMKKIL